MGGSRGRGLVSGRGGILTDEQLQELKELVKDFSDVNCNEIGTSRNAWHKVDCWEQSIHPSSTPQISSPLEIPAPGGDHGAAEGRSVDSSCFFFGDFFGFDCSSARTRANLFTEDPRYKFPFTENSRTNNSILSDLLLRILGPITLCMLSWDIQFHACYLFTEDPRTFKFYKSNN